MSLQKLPEGIQTFAEIREEGYLYVDKTEHLVNMIDSGKVYFLVRPRRFGKSLTCSTFEALFQGKKELFKGLYAEEFLNRPNFKPSPVIRLDMSAVATHKGLEEVEKSISDIIKLASENLNIEFRDNLSFSSILTNLIKETHDKYGEKVVLLIDEYDKPFTDFFDKPDMADEVRRILRGFYSQIKTSDQYLKFIFITGITKTTKMGVFSTLNNITDISFDKKYGKVCGLTKGELERYFIPHLEEVAKEMQISLENLMMKIKEYYDGFCFDGEHYLYNPFSLLSFLRMKKFLNYWIATGTTNFLFNYLKKRNLTVEQFRGIPVVEDSLFNPSTEIEVAPPSNFLYQSGYLSLRKNKEDGSLYLDYPNTEVLNSMSLLLAQNLLSVKSGDEDYHRINLITALKRKNIPDLIASLNRLLAGIPHNDFDEAAKQNIKYNDYKMTPHEWLYRSSLLAFLRGAGVVVSGEVQTNRGRADLVIAVNQNYYVIELKVLSKSTAKQALQQIIDKGYAKPYPNAILLGLAIDDEKRQITEVESSQI